jgi:hypothetical protein
LVLLLRYPLLFFKLRLLLRHLFALQLHLLFMAPVCGFFSFSISAAAPATTAHDQSSLFCSE